MKTAAEILTWCVDNSIEEDFAIIAMFSGHIDSISIDVYVGGFNPATTANRVSLGMANCTNEKRLNDLFEKASALHLANEYANCYLDEYAEHKKQTKASHLKAELAKLEG
jgi:hypothetical protein